MMVDLKGQRFLRKVVALVHLTENEETGGCQLVFGGVTRQGTLLTFVSNFIPRLLQFN